MLQNVILYYYFIFAAQICIWKPAKTIYIFSHQRRFLLFTLPVRSDIPHHPIDIPYYFFMARTKQYKRAPQANRVAAVAARPVIQIARVAASSMVAHPYLPPQSLVVSWLKGRSCNFDIRLYGSVWGNLCLSEGRLPRYSITREVRRMTKDGITPLAKTALSEYDHSSLDSVYTIRLASLEKPAAINITLDTRLETVVVEWLHLLESTA
jgi:hypothetical protein